MLSIGKVTIFEIDWEVQRGRSKSGLPVDWGRKTTMLGLGTGVSGITTWPDHNLGKVDNF
jgi:hypothetical protein